MARERIRLLNSRIDIAAVCERLGIDVRPTGSGLLVGLCPFHDEKVPSFTVYPRNNSWFSFCCGRGGGALHLIAEVEGKSVEAVADGYAEDLPLELARKAVAEMGAGAEDLSPKRYAARAAVRDCLRAVAATVDELEDALEALDVCRSAEELDAETVRILCGIQGREGG